jgi:hypothetical protein
MFNILGSFANAKKPKTVEACAEYVKGHWVVLVRNAGHKNWVPVLDHQKQISDHDAFGEVIHTRASIMTFGTKAQADDYIRVSIPEAAEHRAQRRPSKELVNFSIPSGSRDSMIAA